MKSFEDLGFYCLDNLPPALLPDIVKLADGSALERIAIAPDVRTAGAFGGVIENITAVSGNGERPEILFLDASDEALVRRFSETRRKHPFGGARHLMEAIAVERDALAQLRDRADRVWDTTSLTQGQLKERIAEAFASRPDEHRLNVTLIAFGFKYGLPLDADMVFDVRFLPNPYYEEALRDLTGFDTPVASYIEALPETQTFLDHVDGLVDFLIPQFNREGKSQLTIAIGCTGGRHRSVYLARRLREHLVRDPGLEVAIVTRDIDR